MSARPRVSSTPRLVLLLSNDKQPERALVLHPGMEPDVYPSLDLALDALRAEAAR